MEVPSILSVVCVAVKIPARSFLLDIGLVGISCFALTCICFQAEPIWVASWRQADGAIAKHRIDGAGKQPEAIRREVLQQLTKNRSATTGFARWQKETSLFYARASVGSQPATENGKTNTVADRGSVAASEPVFRTASHATDSRPGFHLPVEYLPADELAREQTPDLLSNDASARWHSHWTRVAGRTDHWLQSQASSQALLVAELDESLRISQINLIPPSRLHATIALAITLATIAVGTLWHMLIPPRTFAFAAEQLLSGGTNEQAASEDEPSVREEATETAAMSFRHHWVRVRQPWAVRLRQAVAWLIVGAAISSLLMCLGGAFV